MNNFKEHFEKYRNDLMKIAPTEKGPKTEAKHKEREDNKFNSYNNECVKILFKEDSSKESFRLFIIDYYEAKKNFRTNDPDSDRDRWCDELCKTFKFDCCEGSYHSEKCELKWIELMEYTFGGLILSI